MTPRKDWEFRAEYLRNAAMRLDKQAEDLKAEARGLRETANVCDREATRLSLQPST